jgi:hypothetical protein
MECFHVFQVVSNNIGLYQWSSLVKSDKQVFSKSYWCTLDENHVALFSSLTHAATLLLFTDNFYYTKNYNISTS